MRRQLQTRSLLTVRGAALPALQARRAGGALLAIALCALISACAENPSYPSLSKITDLGNVLSPEERQKTMQDLQKQEQTHGTEAAKAIEKKDQQ
ncbi:MAG TPA: hypothetical protein VE986_11120 [Hyphomicrobiales bacterium]|nr:hypothetical protein [Hyphomicrobiales bacterium]